MRSIEILDRPVHGYAGGNDPPHARPAEEVDRHAGLAEGAHDTEMGIGPRPAARQHQPDRTAGDHPREALPVGLFAAPQMKMPVGPHGVEPARRVGGVARRVVVHDDDVGELMVGALVEHLARHAAAGRAFGPCQRHQPVGLAHARRVPCLIRLAAAQEHVIVVRFELGHIAAAALDILAGNHMHVDTGDIHLSGQFAREGGRLDVARGGQKCRDARLDHRRFARCGAAQPVGEDLHQRLVNGAVRLGEAAEGGRCQAQEFTVADGADAGRTGHMRCNRHLADDLAGTDERHQRLHAVALHIDAEGAGAEEIERIGIVALMKECSAGRQRHALRRRQHDLAGGRRQRGHEVEAVAVSPGHFRNPPVAPA